MEGIFWECINIEQVLKLTSITDIRVAGFQGTLKSPVRGNECSRNIFQLELSLSLKKKTNRIIANRFCTKQQWNCNLSEFSFAVKCEVSHLLPLPFINLWLVIEAPIPKAISTFQFRIAVFNKYLTSCRLGTIILDPTRRVMPEP